jgi:hypothetical protein
MLNNFEAFYWRSWGRDSNAEHTSSAPYPFVSSTRGRAVKRAPAHWESIKAINEQQQEAQSYYPTEP